MPAKFILPAETDEKILTDFAVSAIMALWSDLGLYGITTKIIRKQEGRTRPNAEETATWEALQKHSQHIKQTILSGLTGPQTEIVLAAVAEKIKSGGAY